MRIGLVAGEASGDLLGAGLIRALREKVPNLCCEGVAGPAMRAEGCVAWEAADALAVFGLIEPLKEIPRLLRLRRMLLQRWSSNPPDVFVGIDAPDFNLGLETKLRRRGIPTAHYVSPTVWAWRQGRVRKIARAVDKVLCILPFEKDFYREQEVSAEFVGHPMADRIVSDPDSAAARRKLGMAATQVVAVLPGSRKTEVSRLGPIFAAACALLIERQPTLRFVAPMATADIRRLFALHLLAAGVSEYFTLLDGEAASAITASDVVLLASGTAALQAALYGRAMVAAYRVAPLTYAIARIFRLIKSPYVTLPNLLLGDEVVPELLQNRATADSVAAAVGDLLSDEARRTTIERRFARLHTELAQGADQRAAEAVLELAKRQ